MKKFKKAYEKVKKAEKEMREAMIKAFPVGSRVFYRHGSHERAGKVEYHNDYGASLLIVTKNNTKIWLDAVKIQGVVIY